MFTLNVVGIGGAGGLRKDGGGGGGGGGHCPGNGAGGGGCGALRNVFRLCVNSDNWDWMFVMRLSVGLTSSDSWFGIMLSKAATTVDEISLALLIVWRLVFNLADLWLFGHA